MNARITATSVVALAMLVVLTSMISPARARAEALLSQGTRLTIDSGEAGDLFGTAVDVDGDTAIVGAPNVGLGVGPAQGRAYVFVRSGDDWALEATIEPTSPIAGSFFGTSVAIDGDTALVGAFFEDEGANVHQGAVYVFTRSAGVWSQQQRLVASDPSANDLFGLSVALRGETAMVGASAGDADAVQNSGAVYVFRRNDGAWTEAQKLTASDPEAGARFGFSVAIDARTAVVGANGKDDGGAAASDAGAAYVFTLADADWTEQQKLLPNGLAEEDLFGVDVAVGGDTILVGSHGDDVGAREDQGSAYVFVRSGTVWSQQQKLTAVGGAEGDRFGVSVALAGDTAVVGATGDDIGFDDQGSAYVFARLGTTWSQRSRLFAGGGDENDALGTSVALDDDTILAGSPLGDVGADADKGAAVFFTIAPSFDQQDKVWSSDADQYDVLGYSVDVSGDTMVVGVPGDDVGANAEQGSAYVFRFDGTSWVEEDRLVASDGQPFDSFGFSVAISGNTIAVGAPDDDVDGNGAEGSIYVFARGGASWNQQAHLFASDGAAVDFVGLSVAIGGDTIVAGAPAHDVGGDVDQGAAYVFVRDGATWSQQDSLTAALGDAFDELGSSVAIDGDRIVVGAYADTVAGHAYQGSVYVYERDGAAWTERARLIAGDGATDDVFGSSVAVSGDTIAVGAYGHDVGGNTVQGAVYVFVGDGASWPQQAKLVASDGAPFDVFGISVAASGDRLLVGADGHDSAEGAAYLFVRTGTTWSEQQQLTGSNAVGGDTFGRAVALKGETAVVGAPYDSGGGDQNRGAAYVFALAGCPRITVDPTDLPDATANDAYDTTVTASGGVAPYGFSVSSGTLPAGIALDPTTGRLSGTPTTAGTYSFTITATDANLCTGSRRYELVVGCSTITVTPSNPSLRAGRVGVAYERTFRARGGAGPYSFALGAGAAPDGLTLDAATGVLSGTPTASGTFSFEVVATDASGCSGAQQYVLTIGA